MNRQVAHHREAPRRDTRPRRRCGYSLIELLLVLAIVSTVLTAVSVSIHVLFRADRQLKVDSAYAQMLPRLSLQLRTDAHAARVVTTLDPPDEPTGVVLATTTVAEVIEYRFAKGRIIRTRRRDQEVLAREVYRLGQHAAARWRVVESPAPLVELEVIRGIGKIDSADARHVDRVVAAIGIRPSGEQDDPEAADPAPADAEKADQEKEGDADVSKQ